MEQLFSGLLVHELTHVFQKFPSKSDGSDKGVTEGIADAVRMRTRFPAPNWPKRDKVGPWDRGYQRTGMFLLYIDQKVPGFINKVNMARGGEWTKETIKSISGKSPEEWWTLYVADPTCSSSNYICGE